MCGPRCNTRRVWSSTVSTCSYETWRENAVCQTRNTHGHVTFITFHSPPQWWANNRVGLLPMHVRDSTKCDLGFSPFENICLEPDWCQHRPLPMGAGTSQVPHFVSEITREPRWIPGTSSQFSGAAQVETVSPDSHEDTAEAAPEPEPAADWGPQMRTRDAHTRIGGASVPHGQNHRQIISTERVHKHLVLCFVSLAGLACVAQFEAVDLCASACACACACACVCACVCVCTCV